MNNPVHTTTETVKRLHPARNRDHPGVAGYSGKVIVAGGAIGRERLNAVEVYDASTAEWSRMKDLKGWTYARLNPCESRLLMDIIQCFPLKCDHWDHAKVLH